MTRFATLLVATRGGEVKECEKHLKSIKKKTNGIIAIRKLNNQTVSPSERLSVTNPKSPDFMLEVKIDKNTNLEEIKRQLKAMTWDVEAIIPY